MIELCSPDSLTPEHYRRIVHDHEQAALADAAFERVERSRALFLKHLDTGVLCYGVNTGLGAQAGIDLTEEEMALLPRHVLLGRASGIGPPFPPAVVRGAMLIRLVQFLTGHSAVTADLCRFVADRLNDGFLPFVPSLGLGMAGEIIPLCHLAQTFVGEGSVLGSDGERRPAAAWLAERGVAPYRPQSKEGLALINGVAVAPALAFEIASGLRRTLALATLAAAASAEGLGASIEAFGADVPKLRPDAGVAEIAASLRHLLAGSQVTRRPRQPPISFRIAPQVHGAARTALGRLEEAIIAEWRTVSDNPAFIPDEASPSFGRLVHGGNFHCAELTAGVEAASLATAQLALLSERRLHRLLDGRASGLAPQLARRPGLDAGLVVLHKTALGLTAKIRAMSVPPSLQHAESSLGQEDAMTMVFPALDQLSELARLARLTVACELYTAFVAIDERGERPGVGVAKALAAARAEIPAYAGDRPYGPELETLDELVETAGLPLPDLWA
jgi:histidine ammonia-lyase